jgi:hypothetical protein
VSARTIEKIRTDNRKKNVPIVSTGLYYRTCSCVLLPSQTYQTQTSITWKGCLPLMVRVACACCLFLCCRYNQTTPLPNADSEGAPRTPAEDGTLLIDSNIDAIKIQDGEYSFYAWEIVIRKTQTHLPRSRRRQKGRRP